MSKTSLQDLNAALFDQLERISSGELSGDDLKAEIKRSEAIVHVSDQITKIADTSLKAAKLYAEHGQAVLNHLPQIASKSDADTD